jgi:hypothetical protein
MQQGERQMTSKIAVKLPGDTILQDKFVEVEGVEAVDVTDGNLLVFGPFETMKYAVAQGHWSEVHVTKVEQEDVRQENDAEVAHGIRDLVMGCKTTLSSDHPSKVMLTIGDWKRLCDLVFKVSERA